MAGRRAHTACKAFNLLETVLGRPKGMAAPSTPSSPSSPAAAAYRPRFTPYEVAWRYQKVLLEHIGRQRKAGTPVEDALLLVQHPSVYTLGRGATVDNLKFVPNTDTDTDQASPRVYRIERGGEVTWHGPGQIVCYPIMDLHNHKKDLHWFTSTLEDAVIDTLAAFNVPAGRSDVNTGVWVGDNKVCAIGVTASRWVTMHGLALNVAPDMAAYDRIVPCGIAVPGKGVCALTQHAPAAALPAVADALLTNLAARFHLDLRPSAEQDLIDLLGQYPDIATATLDKKL